MPIPSEYPLQVYTLLHDNTVRCYTRQLLECIYRPTGDQNLKHVNQECVIWAKIENLARFTPVMEDRWCHRNSFLENSNLLVYWRDVNLIWLPFQPTGVLQKDLPFIVNHENLNLTGIRRLLRKSKVCLIFYIPGYFLTRLELVKLINRNKTIYHKINLSRNIMNYTISSLLQQANQHERIVAKKAIGIFA